MSATTQHVPSVNCLNHCLFVAYVSYRLCLLFGLRYIEAARAALLHDVFLYDQHCKACFRSKGFHFSYHPIAACENAEEICELNDMQRDIILNHMWPLTLHSRPRYIESIIVNCADKICTIAELLHIYHIMHINRKLQLPA